MEGELMAVSDRVREARERAGLSARGLARLAGVSHTAVLQIEHGKPVHPRTLRVLADALGVTEGWLQGTEEAYVLDPHTVLPDMGQHIRKLLDHPEPVTWPPGLAAFISHRDTIGRYKLRPEEVVELAKLGSLLDVAPDGIAGWAFILFLLRAMRGELENLPPLFLEKVVKEEGKGGG